MATTLVWLGDPAAEQYAREVIAKLRAAEDAGGWPRRVAAAQIDLGLALVAAGKPDEAAATAQTAILSGRIVPSNHWRALEVVTAIGDRGLPEAGDLREAYETLRRGGIAPPPRLAIGAGALWHKHVPFEVTALRRRAGLRCAVRRVWAQPESGPW